MKDKEIDQIRAIINVLKHGEIEYFEAKRQCQPLLDQFNLKAAKIAKKYNRKYHPLTFASIAR